MLIIDIWNHKSSFSLSRLVAKKSVVHDNQNKFLSWLKGKIIKKKALRVFSSCFFIVIFSQGILAFYGQFARLNTLIRHVEKPINKLYGIYQHEMMRR